jgi:hypothetical protein
VMAVGKRRLLGNQTKSSVDKRAILPEALCQT